MLTCSVCGGTGHPSCLRLPEEAVYKIRTYEWQCMDCKACGICGDSTDDDKLLFCDQCDRGYHTFCVGLHHTPRGKSMPEQLRPYLQTHGD
ncbi:uncharacterized protein MONBRDRAFT_15569 [Monosiga brevicollis MX1]|uniref:Zinc finger PHD-type domain-containing protein n=1 Tax=Monosiga brevicollis TaxID=81824 RepID=A9UUI9_MONBE|nr:uncharacterized protein MONBRDRAFT_15569 [Monosiga brevicollis MX1]EDQ90910.1 predicted protein [Monosiga brevicollis MX1]|eukprot:XP_001744207.1 hypothetical protein [Monosiga brevicollis MX1]